MPNIQETATTIAGDLIARKLFEARGNHSEVHLTETELSLICSLAFKLGLETAIKFAL